MIAATADWYRGWHNGQDIRALCREQIEAYSRLP
jgi:hypothetical protein